MAQITISDTILDPNGSFPTSGTVTFTLNDWFQDSSGKIRVPKRETASVSSVDGTFSVALESTEDGTPSTRFYTVSFAGTVEGVTVDLSLGSFTLPASPTTVDLSTLLLNGIAVSTDTGEALLTGTAPRVRFYDSSQGTDLKQWDLGTDAGIFFGRTRTDADAAGITWLSVLRGSTTAISAIVLNEDSNDIDFRVESNDNANAFVIDGGTNNIGLLGAVNAGAGVFVNEAARTVTNPDYARFRVGSSNAITTNTGSTDVFGLMINEPNITVGTATPTNSASLYISAAATEATNNYALWVDAGTVKIDETAQILRLGLGAAADASASLITAGDIVVPATTKIRLDGSAAGNTYIFEDTGDRIAFFAGGATRLQIDNGGTLTTTGLIRTSADNTNDLFEPSARGRTGYFGTRVVSGLATNAAGALYVGADGANGLYVDVAADPPVVVQRRSNGTQGTRTNTANGNTIARWLGAAYSGATGYWDTAEMRFVVADTVVDNQRPASSIGFYTNANNAAQTLRLSISPDGHLEFQAAKRFYLDGGDNTYITESSADVLEFVAGNIQYRMTTSALLAPTDNGRDLGATTERWRTGYFGTRVVSGLATNAAGGFYRAAEAAEDSALLDVAVTASGGPILAFNKSRGSQGTRANVVDADQTFRVVGRAYSGATGFWDGAMILGIVDGAVTDNQRPGSKIAFYVNTSNAAQTEHFRIQPTLVGLPGGADFYVNPTKKIHLDAGGDTYLSEAAANQLRFTVGGTSVVDITSGAVRPDTDNSITLGGASNRWSEGHYGGFVAVGTTPASTGALRIANGAVLMSRNAANDGDISIIGMNSSDQVSIGGGHGGGAFPAIRGLAAASFPAGSAANDGLIGIDTTNNRLIFYSNGARYYITGTSF